MTTTALPLFTNLSWKAFRLVRHDLALANPCLLFPVPLFSFTYPKTCFKRTPRFFQGLQWRWAIYGFLDHPFGSWVQYLPSIVVDFPCSLWPFKGERKALQRYQAALSILRCSHLALWTCMGRDVPADHWLNLDPLLVFSSLNPSRVQRSERPF